MKKLSLLCIFALAIMFCFAGCEIKFPQKPQDYQYEYMSGQTTLPSVTAQPEPSVQVTQTMPSENSQEAEATLPQGNENAATEKESEKATEKETEIATSASDTVKIPEVDLSISMPDKNGTMVTDKSPSNKFIGIVSRERRIASDLLVAVYSVPESGQNYVFEFRNPEGRDGDDIRRVYLINEKKEITGVVAADSSEKEGVSSVENWFCMNVLIKEIIYPAMEKDIK